MRSLERRRPRGFTLLELMITVVIVGILASLAVPSYLEYIRKSRRTEARAALTLCAQAMERFMTQNASYVGAVLSNTAGAAVVCAPQSENSFYTLSFNTGVTTSPAVNTGSYTLIATRANSQQLDNCGDFTLNEAGVRGLNNAASGQSVSTCW